jgi:adenosylcobinamide-GDP ribazoletransferase
MLEGVKGIIGFLTIIPIGGNVELEETARFSWTFPLVGALLAFIAAAVGDLSSLLFSTFISSAIAFFSLLLLTGFHHLDGLLDFGDALMYRGNIEKKRAILDDVNTGVGGFSIGFFVLLISYLSIVESPNIYLSLILAETSAKFSMVLGLYFGKPFHEGLGRIFMETNLSKMILSFVIYIGITALLTSLMFSILLSSITIIFSLFIISLSNKTLGGLSGDVFGAMNELTRLVILLVLTWRSMPL